MKHRLCLLVVMVSFIASGAVAMTDDDIVAATILGEARGEGERGMYAVACVIQVRAKERRMTPALVCLQRLQFSCNNSGVQFGLLDAPQAKYARLLAASMGRLDASYVGHANHYHTHGVKPSWSSGREPVKIVGGHRFFRL